MENQLFEVFILIVLLEQLEVSLALKSFLGEALLAKKATAEP